MIEITNTEVFGWEAAIRGMRNPMNSWYISDSDFRANANIIGENDLKLMKTLSNAGTDHSKFLRMIHVQFDLNAPLYFWKEFDTYKVGTVRNSCSTMHKIQSKEFTLEDFSDEHLFCDAREVLLETISTLNCFREIYLDWDKSDEYDKENFTKKEVWWQMIQLLPSSYMQKSTIDLNYQVLRNIRNSDRRNHKLDEWRITFMDWIDSLPYAEELLKKNEL